MFMFERAELEAAIADLVAALNARTVAACITIVGGAAITLAYDETREGTSDIDAFYRHDAAVLDAARAVGARRGYPPDWFNDRALAWWPILGDPCPGVVRTDGSVTIEIASADVPLAMKLRAVRGARDLSDIEVLLPIVEVTSVAQARRLFERYYPDDPFSARAEAAVLNILAV